MCFSKPSAAEILIWQKGHVAPWFWLCPASSSRKPLYPKQFTIKRKDGKQGGYSDTLIGALSWWMFPWNSTKASKNCWFCIDGPTGRPFILWDRPIAWNYGIKCCPLRLNLKPATAYLLDGLIWSLLCKWYWYYMILQYMTYWFLRIIVYNFRHDPKYRPIVHDSYPCHPCRSVAEHLPQSQPSLRVEDWPFLLRILSAKRFHESRWKDS